MRCNNIFIWLYPIITFLISSCYLYDMSYYNFIINLEDKIQQDNENVLSAKILYDEGDGWGEKRLSMLITFKDNQWMLLKEAGYSHSGIIIRSINGYVLIRYRRNIYNGEFSKSSGFYTGFTGKNMDDIINNINHIIQNFEKMAAYMERLDDIESDKFKDKDYDWFWSDEAGMEKEIIENYEQIVFKSSTRKYGEYEPYKEEKEEWGKRLQKDTLR